MKTSAIVIFITIVTLIYILINFYIYYRAVQAFPPRSVTGTWFTILFWIIASTFVVARILERTWSCHVTEAITWIGSFWLAYMLYFFLIVLVLDLTRLIDHFFHIYPASFYTDYQKTKLITFWAAIAAVTLVVLVGYINARIPVIRALDIAILKKVERFKTLRITLASDINMGTIIRKDKTSGLVDRINRTNPDLILFAGDVIDEDIAPVIRFNIGASLRQLKAPLGVYAITGNHEYIGGIGSAVKYLSEHGIRMLRDTVEMIGECIYLIGREDRDKQRFTGKSRKSLSELVSGLDPSYPIILLDHQPFHLNQTTRLGIDLSISGHTHHGQLWPFTYITNAIYEISQGYKKIGNTHFYVSCGYGTWGPPVRLGNRPEIVVLNITFN